jgi:hypothetical protein
VERKKVWVAMHPQTKHGGNEAERDEKTGRLNPDFPDGSVVSAWRWRQPQGASIWEGPE